MTADPFAESIRVDDPPPASPPGDAERRRGYPLPPWSAEARYPSGREVLDWLLELLGAYPETEDGVRQAAAYLDAITTARADAQATASRCAMADHDGALDQLRAADGIANELERLIATQALALRTLEELYVATHRPPVLLVTELDDSDETYATVDLTLGYDRVNTVLDEHARGRITEAAAVAAHAAYERELDAATIVVDTTTLADKGPRFTLVRA